MGTRNVPFWGGPEDGLALRMELPLDECIDVPGHSFPDPEQTDDGDERECRLMYHYRLHVGVLRALSGRKSHHYRYVYQHDWIETQGGGEQEMGLKKFGVGEITETEAEKQDMTKTASPNWTDKDQAELDDESKE